jgi:Putative Tad-like Flp pilus-assembly
MIVILFVGLIALAGIVVDGGAKLDAAENAAALAQEAARAGAALDVSRAYGSGSFVVDPQQAVAAATGYLTAARNRGYRIRRFLVSAVGNDEISVTVTISEPTTFLSVIGVDTFSCTGTAIASLVTGVTGGGS